MRIARSVAELREQLAQLRSGSGSGVGFVPTMGALHEGHLSLIAAARAEHAVTVLSIFVNPMQFNDGGDFTHYPRDEARDLELARDAGVDIVFLPVADEIYPQGFATTVSVDARLTGVLEGEVRGSAHFTGVTTVVSKLLLAVMPDAAYFGEKDFQQLVVVRRMVADLGIPVRIVGCPTLREADGLARSSRNARLSPEDRRSAAAIPQALTRISAAVAAGESDADVLRELGEAVLHDAGLRSEYLAFVHPESLEAVASVSEPTICATAVPVGPVRLIDNILLTPDPVSEGTTHVA